jgi:histone acetyltransferase 1
MPWCTAVHDKKAQHSRMVKELQEGNQKNLQVEEEGRDQDSRDGMQTSTYEEEFSCHASSIINLKLVRSRDDIKDESTTFHPQFTHQIFGEDETIVGYKGLKIDLYYVASTLYTYLSMKYDQQMLGRDDKDPIYTLTKAKITWATSEQCPIGHQFTNMLQEFESHIDDNFTPPGDLVNSYTVDDRTFEIYKANIASPNVQKYHQRVQTFVLFFIDASSYINEEDNRWELFFIFERYRSDTDSIRYGFAGYTTVYPFYAYPDRTRLRISQFLILPPFQRKGHGAKLLQTVYNYGKSINCLEVCVEDPSSEFQKMRDTVDLQNYKDVEKDVQLGAWSEEYWKLIREKIKINRDQIRRCYEMSLLEKIKFKGTDEEFQRQYRLDVKRRLFKLYDLFNIIQDANERKKKLEELYREVEREYIAILTRVHE